MTGTFDKDNPLSFIDAAAKVLELNCSPLHYRDITKQALDRGWIQSNGKTPEATLNAVICVDIKQKGLHSRFVRVRPGIFGLRSWGIESAAVDSPVNPADAENRRVRIPHFPSYVELRLLLPIWNGRLRSQITGLRSTIATLRGSPQEPGDWTKLERWIAERLQGKDRELAEAIWQKTAEKVNPRHVYGQKSNVQRTVLDALRGSLYRFQAVRGTIITTAGFSKGAMQAAFEAGAPPITLIDGSKLIDLLIEYGIGVRTRFSFREATPTVEVLELDADAFAQTEEGENS